ncbi:MAG: serine hydrolase [Phycisphaeraceae bacterium]|nr:serine hydrolase [Phycisphaeraceae bacterium]
MAWFRGVLGLAAAVAVGGMADASGAVAAGSGEPTLEERLEWIATRLDEQRAEQHAPGMALAVVADGRVVLLRGFGQADVEAGLPVSPDTRFAVGSTTKAMTATLVAMLADDGKLGFDDLVSERVPGFRFSNEDLNARATIRDLLSHRSGLAAMEPLWYGLSVTSDEILRAVSRAEPLHPLGAKFVYNNIGYLAAGEAAAHAAGMTWNALISQRLFAPLGMTTANTTAAEAQSDPEMAKGYTWDSRKGELVRQPMRSVDAVAPAGSVNASVRDMSRWVLFQLGRGAIDGKRLLSEERHAETWREHSMMQPGIGYGLGWMLRTWDGENVVEHAGGIDGFTAQVAMIPARNAGYVLLVNQFGSALQESSRQVVFRGLFGDISDSVDFEEDLERFVGRYLANFGTFKDTWFTVTQRGGRLFLDVPGQADYELAPPDEHGVRKFALTDQIKVRFDEQDGHVISLTVFQAGMVFEVPREGAKIPADITEAEAEEYAGVYRYDELNVTVRVRYHNGRLGIEVPGEAIYDLTPPDEDGWRAFRMKDTIKVRFDRDESGRVVAMSHVQDGNETQFRQTSRLRESDRLPTVESVLALVRGAGATDADGTLRSIRAEGSLRLVHVGIEGRETTTATSDGRMRTTLDFGRFGRSDTIVGRDGGWSDSTAVPNVELTEEMLEAVRVQSPLIWVSDWTRTFDRVSVDSRGEIDSRSVIVVRLERNGASPTLMKVDAKSGLPVAMDTRLFNAMGAPYPVTFRFDDWRSVNGVQFPHRVWMDLPMVGRLEGIYDRVVPNVAVEDSIFEPPARD